MTTERLLGKQNFDGLYDEGLKLVQRLKQKNDQIQSEQPEDPQYVYNQVEEAKVEIETNSKNYKRVQLSLDQLTLAIDQKNKRQKMKDAYQKEVQRNKQILEDLINWLYENGKDVMIAAKRKSMIRKQTLRSSSNQKSNASSSLQDQDEDAQQVDLLVPLEKLELDKLLIEEKNEELAALAKNTEELHRMVNDVNIEVLKQDQELDIVVDNQQSTKKNLVDTNKELVEASQYQQQAGKKICVYAVIALVIIGIILGIVWLSK